METLWCILFSAVRSSDAALPKLLWDFLLCVAETCIHVDEQRGEEGGYCCSYVSGRRRDAPVASREAWVGGCSISRRLDRTRVSGQLDWSRTSTRCVSRTYIPSRRSPITSSPRGAMRSIVMSMSVCLSTRITRKPHNLTYQILWMLSLAVTRSTDGVVDYVMFSYHGAIGPESSIALRLKGVSRWRYQLDVRPLQCGTVGKVCCPRLTCLQLGSVSACHSRPNTTCKVGQTFASVSV